MKIVVYLETLGRKEVVTVGDAIHGVNHTTGWLAIESPTKIHWINKDKVINYTVDKEDPK